MKFNSFLKVLLATAVASCFSLNAEAQFGGLLNKAKNKAKEVTKEVTNDAVNKAANKVKDAAKGKVNEVINGTDSGTANGTTTGTAAEQQAQRPVITANSSVPELIKAYYYWADLRDQAIKRKDLEWLCSPDGEQTTNLIVAMSNHKNAKGYKDEIDAAKEHFNEQWNAFKEVKLAGKPAVKITDNASLAQQLAWNVEMAKNGGPNVRRVFTTEACGTLFLNLTRDGFSTESPVAEQIQELQKLWDQLDPETQAKNAECNPYNTVEEMIAFKEKGREAWQKEEAEREAKRKAALEEATKTAKELTGSMNAQWNAQVLKVAKERVPECTKVIVSSNSWDVKREAGVIKCRCIYAWVVMPDGTATDYGFCQDYLGGGKYGNLRNYGIGLNKILVK